jgi:hypothetical protein
MCDLDYMLSRREGIECSILYGVEKHVKESAVNDVRKSELNFTGTVSPPPPLYRAATVGFFNDRKLGFSFLKEGLWRLVDKKQGLCRLVDRKTGTLTSSL